MLGSAAGPGKEARGQDMLSCGAGQGPPEPSGAGVCCRVGSQSVGKGLPSLCPGGFEAKLVNIDLGEEVLAPWVTKWDNA